MKITPRPQAATTQALSSRSPIGTMAGRPYSDNHAHTDATRSLGIFATASGNAQRIAISMFLGKLAAPSARRQKSVAILRISKSFIASPDRLENPCCQDVSEDDLAQPIECWRSEW